MFLKTYFDTKAVFVLNEFPKHGLRLVHGVARAINASSLISAATAPKFSKFEVKNTFCPQLSNGLETQPSNSVQCLLSTSQLCLQTQFEQTSVPKRPLLEASGQRAREGAQGILMSNVSLGGNNYSKNWISFRSLNWIYKKLTEHILASAWLSLWGRHLAGVLTLSSGMLEFQFQVHPVFCIHCSLNWAAIAGLTAWWNPGWSGHLIPHLRFLYVYVLSLELCPIQLFATLWTVEHQAPLSMGFSRQEY